MTSTIRVPSLDACAAVYVAAREAFEDDPFDADDLGRHLLEREGPNGVAPHDDALVAHLAFLVGAGALDRREDGRFRAWHPPDAPDDEWREGAAATASALASAVARAPGETEPAETGMAAFRYRGERYVSVSVPSDDLADRIADAMADAPSAAGVGLYAPADAVGPVQHVADRLCDEFPTEEVAVRFEKETSEVVAVDDGLEFRLYLRAV
ncbi:hypothetical protein ACFQPA_05325 [Halomarina halobia]|uniref:Halobacterial output domain-containing protein n=1 Tax=Halomarina halobia TaxID=3033386 RepID=A0ABD6A5G1_9EURY|nr:hypothetical protein [Halomarina sp. PSR21]